MPEDAILRINPLLISANYRQGGGIPQRTPKGKEYLSLQKCFGFLNRLLK